MGVFNETDYKPLLRSRIRELSKTRKGYSLRQVATRVGIQYTYLSRLLNDERYHLSEDQLFLLGKDLEFFPEELEYLGLLRAHASSSVPERKKLLLAEIERLRAANELDAPLQRPSSSKVNQEIAYLLDPLCVIVHSSLEIKAFFDNPKLLCDKLNLSADKLRATLRSLDQLGFIELASDGLTVVKLKQPDTHYGVDHPLMRSHQNLLRVLSAAQIMNSDEELRDNFMVTFTADEKAFGEVKVAFKTFIKGIERIVATSKNVHTYQLNFDLFQWL